MTALIAFLFTFAALVGACTGDTGSSDVTGKAPSDISYTAVVTGTVTYHERISLTQGARLVVELRDVSLADASAPLIARQTINNPGQVPIRFRVEYNTNDINPRNTYSVSATIHESDDRMAFTNDTAHEVITRGNPESANMVLVLVEPPPDTIKGGADWRTWVETPARITRANLVRGEREPMLRVQYYQSTIENCARPGNEQLRLEGTDIVVSVTLMQPPETPWAIPCDEELVELDAVLPIEAGLKSGQTYRVVVNGEAITTFTPPDERLPHSTMARSQVLRTEVRELEATPVLYQLTVLSARPVGSSCSRYNGYEVRRKEDRRIDVIITHHQVADGSVMCTKDAPTDRTAVPLGSDFKTGVNYEIVVNSDTAVSFVAR